MSKNWLELLNWNEEQLDDLRFTGFSYIRQGKYDIALPIFEALAILDPESGYDIQTLGALHLQLGNAKQALGCFEKALKLEGDHTPTLLNLAKTFFTLGKVDEGLKLAHILKNEKELRISNYAKALILAYG